MVISNLDRIPLFGETVSTLPILQNTEGTEMSPNSQLTSKPSMKFRFLLYKSLLNSY